MCAPAEMDPAQVTKFMAMDSCGGLVPIHDTDQCKAIEPADAAKRALCGAAYNGWPKAHTATGTATGKSTPEVCAAAGCAYTPPSELSRDAGLRVVRHADGWVEYTGKITTGA
jgi:hypothetical protein